MFAPSKGGGGGFKFDKFRSARTNGVQWASNIGKGRVSKATRPKTKHRQSCHVGMVGKQNHGSDTVLATK